MLAQYYLNEVFFMELKKYYDLFSSELMDQTLLACRFTFDW